MFQHLKIVRYDLEKLVAEQIPDYRSRKDGRKFRVHCPYCEEGKTPALSILPDFKAGICFRCNILFIGDDTQGELRMDEDFLSCIDSLRPAKLKDVLCNVSSTILSLYDQIKDNKFLETRNPFVPDWNYYGIRQGDHEVVTPYYLFGELVYYQIRHYEPRGFKNPTGINAPLYIPSNTGKSPGLWYQDVPTVIVEGPFDAIAYDVARRFLKKRFNIAALGGKVVTQYRVNLLRELGVTKLVLNLDEYELSRNLKDQLAEFGFRRSDINIVPSSGPDPEEVLRSMGLEKFSHFVEKYIYQDRKPSGRGYGFQIRDLHLDSFKMSFK